MQSYAIACLDTNWIDSHLERFGGGALTKCLYQFDEPVSPHIAAKSKTVSTRMHT